MTNKEIGELRRRMKPDRTNLTAVYGCYVASSGEVLSTFREPFGLMTEEDKEKYLAIFRRALSGTPDKNLLDLSFTTKQVADSDEHRLLMRLRETSLDDEEARQKLFQTIIGAVSFEENFLILLAHERYDVPFKAKDGAKLDDGSEVFSYFVCAICPALVGHYAVWPGCFHSAWLFCPWLSDYWLCCWLDCNCDVVHFRCFGHIYWRNLG